MLAYIDWHTSPVIFEIFGFPLRWYGLMFAGAFLVGYQVLSYMFKKEGRPIEQADELLLYAMVATVIGARMGHYFFYEYPLLLSNPVKFFIDMVVPPYSGLASHGAAIGLFTAFYIFSKKRNIPYLYVTDRIVPTVALGGAFIRFGNLMNSEIVGKPTDVPWAFRFFNDPEHPVLLPRHPAQLYESLSCILLFLLLMWIWSLKKENTRQGLMTGVFLIILFTLRFLYEFVKENQVNFEDGMQFNMGQILSIPALLFGAGILVYAFRKKETQNS
jgi:phosphatidylglycerol:prolipoprotein diacylglycerol transferase